jgi:hypothetical protein
MREVTNTTITIDIIDTIQPYAYSDNITVAIAPGPASRGNANGTIPESPDAEERLYLHSPCVRNSIDIMNSNIPPAIIKLKMLIPKIDSN